MFARVDTRDTHAVLQACRAAWRTTVGSEEPEFLTVAFQRLREAFAGDHPGYEPLDTRYHDLEHTMQGALCLARLLAGWSRSSDPLPLDSTAVRRGLVAILLHDTGYLKSRGDRSGTGAKFTLIHVQRSAEFAAKFLAAEGFPPEDIPAVQSMICCTGVYADVRSLTFHRRVDRRVGCALATADLLGQMAADDYVARLPALYAEFAEAAAAARTPSEAAALGGFRSAEDLIQRTPEFWRSYVLPRLENEFEGVYRFLNDPWPDGPNEYLQRVEANLATIEPRPVLSDR